MSRKRAPQRGLEPRDCVICGKRFQPYREKTITCSRSCYNKQPHAREATRIHHAQQHIKDRKNAARRDRWAVEPGRRRKQLAYQLPRLYGVSLDQYEAMRDAQGNRCAICGESPDPNGIKAASRLHVDHNHQTGENRELLCCRCNQGIGYFKDDPLLFRAAADYITRHRMIQEASHGGKFS